jgi:hypothetical protein
MVPTLPHNSRYRHIETATRTENGREIVFFRRRFLPQPEQLALVQMHRLQQSDRLDNLAARYFADPELFWRLCDANRAMNPPDLTEPAGKRLRVTMPAGISDSAVMIAPGTLSGPNNA